MIYNKKFSNEDFQVMLDTFDASEVFFSFISEETEPRIVEVAKNIDPTLIIQAAIIPSISKDHVLEGLNILMNEEPNFVQLLDRNYRGFDFGREDMHNEETLKQFVRTHPLSSASLRILSLGVFDEDFLIEATKLYIRLINQGERSGLMGLIRLTTNRGWRTEETRQELWDLLNNCTMMYGLERSFFNINSLTEEEFVHYYTLLDDKFRHEALANPACPPALRSNCLEAGVWSHLTALATAPNLSVDHSEILAYMLNEEIENWLSEQASEEERLGFIITLENFLNNRAVPISFVSEICSNSYIILRKDIHEAVLGAIASRLHEDETLITVAQQIMDSYSLTTEESMSVLISHNPETDENLEIPKEIQDSVNNILSFFYKILQNPLISSDIVSIVQSQGSFATETISLTTIPHPNLGEAQALQVIDKYIGTPFETLALLHIRNPEVMKIVAERADELAVKSKIAIAMNPKVYGETYLALALQEEEPALRDMFMRAGGEAHVDNELGGLFLTELNTESKIEAWKSRGRTKQRANIRYANFTITS